MQLDVKEQLLTAKELAEALGVKESWTRWATHKDMIPVYRIGKYRRYLLNEVLVALQEKGLQGR